MSREYGSAGGGIEHMLGSQDTAAVEKGRNVEVIVKIMRHGERNVTGELTDYGREITRQRAEESGLAERGFDAVKAYGSDAGPRNSAKMGRSRETADIYAKEIANDGALKSRPRDVFSYEKLVNPVPFDYEPIYKAALPGNYDQLSPEEKAKANKRAQIVVVDHLMRLNNPEAENYRREVAGAFSKFILHKERMATKLKDGSRVLMPSGTHGGMIEPFLHQTLVRRMEDGSEVHGFQSLDEIGGDFDPSEAFDIKIVTDKKGNVGPLQVTWDSPQRPSAPEMYLDEAKMKELAVFYDELHPREAIEEAEENSS